MIVFFKQKTAYEMRSSDWSSDVCSSDLIRHGYKLGLNGAFFYKLVAPLAEIMGGAYPELNDKRELIEKTIRAEEDSFAITLDTGMQLLEEAIARLSDKTIPADVVFKLYDPYGFPFDQLGRASFRESGCRYS